MRICIKFILSIFLCAATTLVLAAEPESCFVDVVRDFDATPNSDYDQRFRPECFL